MKKYKSLVFEIFKFYRLSQLYVSNLYFQSYKYFLLDIEKVHLCVFMIKLRNDIIMNNINKYKYNKRKML